MNKVSGFYTVRNSLGQFLGCYRASSEQQAIARFTNEMAATAATFRKSQPMAKFVGLSAKIETAVT